MTSPAAAAVLVTRCDAFGAETGGPRHLLGGLYGPEANGPKHWYCKNPMDGRYTMSCAHAHKGLPQNLCHEHVYMIRKRMSGICPPCVSPPAAREITEAMQRVQAGAVPRLDALVTRGGTELDVATLSMQMESELWVLQERMNELQLGHAQPELARLVDKAVAQLGNTGDRGEQLLWDLNGKIRAGIIHRCHLRLTEIS